MRVVYVLLVLLTVLSVCLAAVPALAQTTDENVNDSALSQKRITLNVRDADLKTVLMSIFNQAGVNYTFAAEVQGMVTANIDNQPVDVALRLLLSPRGYTWKKTGDVYIVAKREEVEKPIGGQYEPPSIDISDPITEEVRLEKIPLNFVDAYDIVAILNGEDTRSREYNNIGGLYGGFGGGLGYMGPGMGNFNQGFNGMNNGYGYNGMGYNGINYGNGYNNRYDQGYRNNQGSGYFPQYGEVWDSNSVNNLPKIRR
ncbi:MAG TPA: secretin and TonB N-terminal domain-containing protein [Armatimonadota bacterium]|nr:secretin and TonB N-terminal domain-containing protein [Armatimonadota bacterium]